MLLLVKRLKTTYNKSIISLTPKRHYFKTTFDQIIILTAPFLFAQKRTTNLKKKFKLLKNCIFLFIDSSFWKFYGYNFGNILDRTFFLQFFESKTTYRHKKKNKKNKVILLLRKRSIFYLMYN